MLRLRADPLVMRRTAGAAPPTSVAPRRAMRLCTSGCACRARDMLGHASLAAAAASGQGAETKGEGEQTSSSVDAPLRCSRPGRVRRASTLQGPKDRGCRAGRSQPHDALFVSASKMPTCLVFLAMSTGRIPALQGDRASRQPGQVTCARGGAEPQDHGAATEALPAGCGSHTGCEAPHASGHRLLRLACGPGHADGRGPGRPLRRAQWRVRWEEAAGREFRDGSLSLTRGQWPTWCRRLRDGESTTAPALRWSSPSPGSRQ